MRITQFKFVYVIFYCLQNRQSTTINFVFFLTTFSEIVENKVQKQIVEKIMCLITVLCVLYVIIKILLLLGKYVTIKLSDTTWAPMNGGRGDITLVLNRTHSNWAQSDITTIYFSREISI